MKIKEQTYQVRRFQVEDKLKNKENAKEVLDLLFGDDLCESSYYRDWTVVWTCNPYDKTTMFQRLNRFWLS